MKIRVPKYFEEFNCIASQCEDTCCAGWGIVIDEESYKKYQSVEGKFGERLRSEITNDGEDNVFILKGKNCPFLNESKMCDIYTELGEDSLCYTCQQYPRYTEEFGNLREVGISLSCPEAARIILKDEKIVEFVVSENDEVVSTYNDINPKLFIELIQCRKIIIDLIQNQNIDFNSKLALALNFTKEIQDKIDKDEIAEIGKIKNKYKEIDFISNEIKKLDKYKNKELDKYNNIKEYFNVFKNLKHITPNDPLGLERLMYFWGSDEGLELYIKKHKDFDNYYKSKEYKFENIVVYFIFRYFMKSVFDYDVLAKIKTAIVSYLVIKEIALVSWIENDELTDEDIVNISQMYSKDVEHLEENIETLAEIFETNESLFVDEINSILMN